MKVDIVKQSFQSKAAKPDLKVSGAKNTPNFTGMSSKQLEKEMMNLLYHKKTIEFMKSFEWLKGEIGGILLTALGTGAVAPIFIGFNPFVHAPKDATPEEKEDVINTKQYTAMRQPVSAALAILFQAGVQKYIDKGLDAIFNNPERAKKVYINVDRQVINTDTYIKDKVKNQLAERGYKKPSIIKSWFNGKAKQDREIYNAMFDSSVEAMKEDQLKKVTTDLKNDHIIHIGERDLEHRETAELINKQIESYKDDAEKLQKSKLQIEKYVKKAEILMNNEAHLRTIFKEVPVDEAKVSLRNYLTAMREVPVDEAKAAECKAKLDKINKEVSNAIQKLIDKETNNEVKTLLQEIMSRPEDMRAHRFERTIKRIDTIENICAKYKGGFTAKNYEKALLDRNELLDQRWLDLDRARIKEPDKADKKVIEEAIEKIKKACHFDEKNTVLKSLLENTDTFSSDDVKLKDKIYKDVAKAYKKMVENHYKGWNQLTKVGVGVLITLPITCTALNWVYPRFMELFFPKLAGVKKDKAPEQVQNQGGNK